MAVDLAKHVLSLTEVGSWSTSAPITSGRGQVDALFASIPPGARVALHVHGGLVGKADAVAGRVEPLTPRYLARGVHPIFLVWETAALDIAEQVLGDVFTRPIVNLLRRRLPEPDVAFGFPDPDAAIRDEEVRDALAGDEEAQRALVATAAPSAGAPGFLPIVPILGVAALSVAAGVVGQRVLARRSDPSAWNGWNDTLLEEIVRVLYLGSLGKIGWSQIKRNAMDAWGPDRDASYVLAHLEQHLASGGRLSMVAHSAGSYHAGALLQALAGRVPGTATIVDRLMFVAPACDYAFYDDVVRRHAARVARTGLFVLRREVEDTSRMVPGVYQGSLLNAVSGLLEEEPGWPILGLARFLGPVPPPLIVQAPTADGDKVRSSATEHGGFDLEPDTFNSLLDEIHPALPLGAMHVIGGFEAGARFGAACALRDAYGLVGSGVLVGPTAVLTAAHVASAVAFAEFEKGKAIPIADIEVREGYGQDLALLKLDDGVEITPAALSNQTPVPLRDHVVVVGFGTDQPDGSGGAGVRRAARIPVTWSRAAGGPWVPPWSGARRVFDGEWIAGHPDLQRDTAPGDSGGPAFRPDSDGGVVVGITSRRATDRPVGGGVYVDVASHRAWIEAILTKWSEG